MYLYNSLNRPNRVVYEGFYNCTGYYNTLIILFQHALYDLQDLRF